MATIKSETLTESQVRRRGLVIAGEWGGAGAGVQGSGWIVSEPENADAVKAAYDAIEEDADATSILDDVIAAGGWYVREAYDDDYRFEDPGHA